MTKCPSKTLTPAEVGFIKEFIEELQALVEADDGDVFLIQHIEMLDTLTEIIYDDAPTDA